MHTVRSTPPQESVHAPVVRPPAVAGMFYPGDPKTLRAMVEEFLAQARTDEPPPKALIAPHAGYIYSGPIAATAYARLRNATQRIERVVLLGPAHRVGFYGLAASSAAYFQTPLGTVPLDREALDRVIALPEVFYYDGAHAQEHSLEVHLPFLQVVLGEFKLVPLVVGSASPDEVAAVLEGLWGGPETLIVASSDLSHYLDYASAQAIDAQTSRAIEQLEPERIRHENACGYVGLRGLLRVAKAKGLTARTLDLRNSGDTAGPREQVVGYGAYAIG